MNPVPQDAVSRRASIASHIARRDLLGLYREGIPDYKRIADLVQLSKADLGKLAGVAKSSVRFDASIPVPGAERLRGLGNIPPRNMIRGGRYKRLLNFVLDAREAENATPGPSGDPVTSRESVQR